MTWLIFLDRAGGLVRACSFLISGFLVSALGCSETPNANKPTIQPLQGVSVSEDQGSGGEVIALPAEYPSDGFVPAGARIVSVAVAVDVVSVSWSVAGTTNEVFDQLRHEFAVRGWGPRTAIISATDPSLLQVVKPGRLLHVEIRPADAGEVLVSQMFTVVRD
jgi:hypothetical protein